jgi:hypothetical protein
MVNGCGILDTVIFDIIMAKKLNRQHFKRTALESVARSGTTTLLHKICARNRVNRTYLAQNLAF